MGGSKEVRCATLDDLPHLIEMGRHHYAASPWASVVEFDVGRCTAALTQIMESPDGILLISGAGMIGAMCFEIYPAAFKVCQEILWWSESGTGVVLKRALETAAQEHGAAAVLLSARDNEKLTSMDGVLRRWGYRPLDHIYMREF